MQFSVCLCVSLCAASWGVNQRMEDCSLLLSVYLQTPGLIMVALFPVQLPVDGAGKQYRMVRVLEPLHPMGKSGGGSWPLAVDRLNSNHCGSLGTEPAD